LFGRNKQQSEQQYLGTITRIPKYGDVMKILGDFISSAFRLDEKVLTMFGITFDGIAMDEKHICMLAPTPSSFTPQSEFEEIPLNSLKLGSDEDGEAIVGFYKTVVKKKYVAGFVHVMKEVYNVKWQEIYALVHRKEPFPIILHSNLWTFQIAPFMHVTRGLFGQKIVDWDKISWVKGKYDPEAEIMGYGYTCKECVYSDGYLVESPKPSFMGVLTGISECELKEHWSCVKFGFNLDGRLGLAEKCTNYLTQEEYEQKCLSGTMEPPERPIMFECVYCRATYDVTKSSSCPNCGATLKKKLK